MQATLKIIKISLFSQSSSNVDAITRQNTFVTICYLLPFSSGQPLSSLYTQTICMRRDINVQTEFRENEIYPVCIVNSQICIFVICVIDKFIIIIQNPRAVFIKDYLPYKVWSPDYS